MRRTVAVTALVVALGACVGNPGDGRETPGDKQEWSILQTVEYGSRGHHFAELQFRTAYGYEVMGVPVDEDRRTIWIMLRPRHAPFYKQMPANSNWSIDSARIDELVRRHAVTSTVEEAIRSHVLVAGR